LVIAAQLRRIDPPSFQSTTTTLSGLLGTHNV
jgi:hypothetical protein